jgi:hypothetical protein
VTTDIYEGEAKKFADEFGITEDMLPTVFNFNYFIN